MEQAHKGSTSKTALQSVGVHLLPQRGKRSHSDPDLRSKDFIWRELVTAAQFLTKPPKEVSSLESNPTQDHSSTHDSHNSQNTGKFTEEQQVEMLGEFYTQLSKRSSRVSDDLTDPEFKPRVGGSVRNLLENKRSNTPVLPVENPKMTTSQTSSSKSTSIFHNLFRKKDKEENPDQNRLRSGTEDIKKKSKDTFD